ncbi:unnamed protein product [Trifolium pratense]|uniref:Uncharacterized protein n=1 Tax=Trifolium pratense TaxID=57577 RepID=A0ACB0IVX9_TRIPR|nr:unnamed protein product [Trifolium pratense]
MMTMLLRRRTTSYLRNLTTKTTTQQGGCDKDQNFTQILNEICTITRTKPCWEHTLLSRYPFFNFSNPNFFLLYHNHQKNSFLSLRFLHWLTSHCGFSPDQSSCDVLFDALVDAGACKAAKLLLGYPHFIPKNASLECYIRCLSNGGMVEEAFDVFVSLKKVGFLPSVSTFNVSLLACLKVGRTDLVWKLKLYEEMCGRGYAESVVSYTTMISGLCLHGKTDEALSLFHEMSRKGIARDLISYNSLINGLCQKGELVKATDLLHELLAQGLEPSVSSFTPLIKRLCEVGDIEGAKRLLKDMHDRHLEPIATTHDYIIIGLCKEGNLTESMEWLLDMLSWKLKPKEQTFEHLIDSLTQEDRGYAANMVSYTTMISGLFHEMSRKGVARDFTSYNSLIKGLCQKGELVKATDLLHELLAHGLEPSVS